MFHRLPILMTICFLVLIGCANEVGMSEAKPEASSNNVHAVSKAWRYGAVGVADLDAALGLWRDQFGFDIVYAADGPDAALSRLWGLAPDAVARQAMLDGSPGESGMLHLIEFAEPLASVRGDAALYDSLPKNIDVYTDDIFARIDDLKRAGYAFRSETPQEFMSNGVRVREVHMPAHDDTNIVIIERDDTQFVLNEKNYYGVGLIIATVDDVEEEEAFLRDLLDLDVANAVELSGPELEAATGLPPGTRWLIRILGDIENFAGQIELVEYRGVEGDNLYDRAVPGALGLFELTYGVSDLAVAEKRLAGHQGGYRKTENVAIAGECYHSLRFRSPAGMPLQLLAPANGC